VETAQRELEQFKLNSEQARVNSDTYFYQIQKDQQLISMLERSKKELETKFLEIESELLNTKTFKNKIESEK
jgi:hypothetical protein